MKTRADEIRDRMQSLAMLRDLGLVPVIAQLEVLNAELESENKALRKIKGEAMMNANKPDTVTVSVDFFKAAFALQDQHAALLEACTMANALIHVMMKHIGDNPDCCMDNTRSVQAAFIKTSEAIQQAKEK